MAEACEVLGTPVVSGNVSLYNESGGRPIHPTPVVGCVGRARERVRPPCRRRPPTAPGRSSRWARRRRPTTAPSGRRWSPARRPGASPRSTCRRCAGSATCSPSSPATACCARRTTSPTAASPSRWPRSRWPPAPASTSTLDPGEGDAATALFGECCGLVVVSCAAGGRGAAGRGVRLCRGAIRADRDAGRRERSPLRCGELALDVALEDGARGLRGHAPASDGGRLMCGVFGIHAPGRDVARLAYFALYALQHRGQESAGIAVSDGRRVLTVRDMGLVAQVFDEGKLQALPGRAAIGHARYSTTGSAHWINSQPIVAHRPGPHGRARPQRQPHEHQRAARGAAGAGRQARLDLRHRGHLRAHRAPPGHARRGRGARAWSASPARSRRSC